MSDNINVMEALYDHLLELRSDFIIVFQLNKYDPQHNGREPYLRINLNRNAPLRLTMDNGGQYLDRGILQVTLVHAPSEDQGFMSEPEYLSLATIVQDHFKSDTRLFQQGIIVRIPNKPTVGPIMSDAAQIQLPISIEWQTVN